jgi:DNA replication protein DnaC
MEDQDEAWLRRRPQYAQVMAWEYGPRGLLLIGETGCQKTRLAFLLLRREHMAGRNVGYLPAVSFGAMLKAAANRKFGGDGVLLAAWKKVDLLLIDDLGKGGIGDLHEPEMYSIFEARSMARLPTITTQNVGGKDLAAAMSEDRGAPFRRRLQEFFHEAIPFRA